MGKTNQRNLSFKPVEQLEFTDDYMFGYVMRNPEICKELLERLLKIKIERLERLIQEQIDRQKRDKEALIPFKAKAIITGVSRDDKNRFQYEVFLFRAFLCPFMFLMNKL